MQTWRALYRRACLAWCSLVLVLGMGIGQATMRTLSMADLVKQADTIVLGIVLHQESAWDTQRTAIYTDVMLRVERAITGAPGETVTLRVAGGKVGGMGMRTSNDATFQNGERVIVFLDTSAFPGSVVGMQQGKFTVQGNMVTRADKSWSLDTFMAAVRTAVR